MRGIAPQDWQSEGILVVSLELQGHRLPESGKSVYIRSSGPGSQELSHCHLYPRKRRASRESAPPHYSPLLPTSCRASPRLHLHLRLECKWARPPSAESQPLEPAGRGMLRPGRATAPAHPGGSACGARSEGRGEEKDALVFKPHVLF